MFHKPVPRGTEWTLEPVICGFCGQPDEGYAKQDKDGKWKPSCWACVKPKKTIIPVKRDPVDCPPMEDLDLDEIIKPRKFIFEVPRITADGLVALKNRITARKAGKKIEEPAEVEVQEKSNDSTSSHRAVHTRRTKLAAMDVATDERTSMARPRK